ncbi:MAG: EamA family transporter [Candidatus Diapherotrites archaeon]|nr:EamA family transporter [Candidatus Diapherotrites archaeon]
MWFALALFSMLAYGVLDFLFKVAEASELDFSNLFLYYYWTASLAAFALFALFPEKILDFSFLAFFAVAQVSLYLLANVLKLESLKHVKSILAYPLFALHGVIAAVLAFFFLGESLQPLQYFGIALSVAAILLLVEKRHHFTLSRGALFALGAAVFFAASELIVAAVIDNLVILPFIALSYFFAIGPTFVLEKNLHKRGGKKKGSLKIGAAMGLTNLAAFSSMLLALQSGPASVIFPVIALSLLVSVVLSMAAYHEKINFMKKLAIALALIAIIVMHI